MLRRLVLVLAFLFMLGGCAATNEFIDGLGLGSLTGPSDEEIAQMETSSLSVLLKDFRDNSVAAEAKYAGNWYKFGGYIVDTPREIKYSDNRTMMYELHLGQSKNSSYFDRTAVPCRFRPAQRDEVMQLKKGQYVVLYAKVSGFSDTKRKYTLENCRVVGRK